MARFKFFGGCLELTRRRDPLAGQDEVAATHDVNIARQAFVTNISHVGVNAEQSRYRKMLTDLSPTGGLPLLVDFKDLSYQGTFFTITPVNPTARMQLRCSLAEAIGKSKGGNREFLEELAAIRALQDEIMIRAGKHKRNVNGKIVGFWKIEETDANGKLLQNFYPQETASFTDLTGNSLYYVHKDHGHPAVIPFPFRGTGNTYNETGLDSAKDIFIVQEGMLRVSTRLDVPDRFATTGGFDEGHMHTRALEVLEEVIVGSIVDSQFYRDSLQNLTAEEIQKIGIEANEGEHILDAIARLPNKKADDRKHYTKVCSQAMQVADNKNKQQNSAYKTTFELVKDKIRIVPDTLFHNAFEHRASTATVVQTSASFLLVDETLTEELFTNRNMAFVAGDDNQKTQLLTVPNFLLQAWGGHGALLMLLYRALSGRSGLADEEQAMLKVLEQGLDQLAADPTQLAELHAQATKDLLALVYQDLNYYKNDTAHQAAGVAGALVNNISAIARTRMPRAMYQQLSLALQQEKSDNGPLHQAMQRHLAQLEPGQQGKITPEQWVQLGKDLVQPRPWYSCCPPIAERMKSLLPSCCMK